MHIVRTILASIFILYIWIWLINTAFGKNSLKGKYIWKIILIWILLVGGLVSYKYLFSHTESGLNLNIMDNLNIKTLSIFWLYCVWILTVLLFIFRKRANIILQVFLGWAIFFLMISFWWLFLWVNSLILYYIITAYAEEYMKYTSSTTLLWDVSNEIKDWIFFCVIIWLGFSLIENIFYLISFIDSSWNLVSLLIGRWLISALLHVVATTTIWALYYSLKQKIFRPVALFVSIVWWVLLHWWYNLWLEYKLSIVTIPMVVFFFFLLSFFLFKSDMLYMKKWQ